MDNTRVYFQILLLIFVSTLFHCSSTPNSSLTLTPILCTADKEISCESLAAMWSDGTARCRSDGLGYDVSQCKRTGNDSKWIREIVYPAQRDANRWKDARCNKEGDFFFEITVPPQPNGQWEIQLEAGGFCAFDGIDQAGCSTRNWALVSDRFSASRHFSSDWTIDEADDDRDPDFGNMIHVKAHYCSSDMWTGSNTTGVPIHYQDGSYGNWMFTGHINYEAMMDILQQRYGLHDDDPKLEILFRSSSAGAWGTMNNSWDMNGRFPTVANRGQLMVSSWSAFVPNTWADPNYPVFGITRPEPLTELGAFKLLYDAWKSVVYQKCAENNPSQPQTCMFGPKIYNYITGPKTETNGNMDLPMLVFQNRQDQLYMDLANIPPEYNGMSDQDQHARDTFEEQMNDAMGIDPDVPNKSSKIKWLYAVSDPDVMGDINDPNTLEPNVHPPLCYLFRSPGGSGLKTLDQMYREFWNSRGKGPGRGQLPGVVQTYEGNFVTLQTGDCAEDGDED